MNPDTQDPDQQLMEWVAQRERREGLYRETPRFSSKVFTVLKAICAFVAIAFVGALFCQPRGIPAAVVPPAGQTAAVPPGVDERTNEQMLAAKQFTFEGVALSCSLKDFLLKYPSAQLLGSESQANLGIKCYCVRALQSADMAQYTFLDDTLFEVTVVYTHEGLKKIGGEKVLLNRLTDKFGPPDRDFSAGRVVKDGEEVFRWHLRGARRVFAYSYRPNLCLILFFDSSKNELANKRKAEKANVGF
jgi:hypothetical protein